MADIKGIARFMISILKTAKTHEEALKSIVGHIGAAVGGGTEVELNDALSEAIKGRKAAGAAMQEAGRFRPS